MGLLVVVAPHGYLKYKHLHGRDLEHPFVAVRHMVIVIRCHLDEMDFRTGVELE